LGPVNHGHRRNSHFIKDKQAHSRFAGNIKNDDADIKDDEHLKEEAKVQKRKMMQKRKLNRVKSVMLPESAT